MERNDACSGAPQTRNQKVIQFVLYSLVGISAFALEVFLFWLAMKIPIRPPELLVVVANAIAMGITICWNFTLQKLITFKAKGDVRRQLLFFLLLLCFNKVIQSGLLVLAVRLHQDPVITKVVVMTIVVFWNFIIYRKVVFK